MSENGTGGREQMEGNTILILVEQIQVMTREIDLVESYVFFFQAEDGIRDSDM